MKSQKDKSEQQSSRQRRDPTWKEGIEKSMTRKEKADVKFTRAKEFLGLSALHGPFLLQLQHRRSEDPLDLLWHVPPGLVVLGLDCAAWLHLSRRGGRERTVWLHSTDSYHVRSECCHSLLCKKTANMCRNTGNIQAFHMKQAHHKADFSSSPFRFILFWLVATCKQKVWRKGGGASLLIKMNILELFL